MSALTEQAGGSHYKGMAIQPIEYIMANQLDYLQGNVVKYISRHKAKNGAEDIRKAIHYCSLILELQYPKKSMEFKAADQIESVGTNVNAVV